MIYYDEICAATSSSTWKAVTSYHGPDVVTGAVEQVEDCAAGLVGIVVPFPFGLQIRNVM